MIRNLLFIFLAFLGLGNLCAQDNTVGLISYNPSKAMDGYNLFYPHRQPNTYLVDNCGQIVHQWLGDEGTVPGNMAYLREDGTLIKTTRPGSVTGDAIWAGGGGATIEIRDWENNLAWSYTKNDASARLHHDIAIKENGNILAIVWEYKDIDACIQAGRDTSTLSQGAMWPDKIIELDPRLNSTEPIVWEWNVWDHLIQDFDPTKDNFGVVADHPERININYDDNDGKADWMHSNAIDYNEERGQIILSVPTFHEVWVIDNTTTTEQAAGSNGGFGNSGGDLNYRFGNPAAHNNGTADDQLLFYQHDIKYIDDFLSPSHPHFGKFSVFNNRVGSDFSTANIFDANWDMYKWSYVKEDKQWGPDEFDETIQHPVASNMWSTGLSSFQILPNGNYLICVGRFGYTFELTPDNEIVWEYITPLNGGGEPATQGDSLEINNNLTFRVTRIPSDYEAFDGKDLSGGAYIELEPNTTFCDQILSTESTPMYYDLKVYPNPANDWLTLECNTGKSVNITIYDLLGRPIETFEVMGGRKYVDISNWDTGIYLVEINKREMRKLIVH